MAYDGGPAIIAMVPLTAEQLEELYETTHDLLSLATWHEAKSLDWHVIGVDPETAQTIRRQARERAAAG